MAYRNNRVRAIVLSLWAQSHEDGRFVSSLLADTFREQPTLLDAERAEIVQTLHAMIRMARYIDYALETAVKEMPDEDERDYARYLCCRLFSGDFDMREAAKALPIVDWREVRRVEARIKAEPDKVRRLALTNSLPDWLAVKLLTEYGDEASALAEALNVRPELTLRVNTLKTTRKAVLDSLAESNIDASPTSLSKLGIRLEAHANVFKLDSFQNGDFEVQDEGSQMVAEVAAPSPGSVVVDFCAGAGGKTLALGAMMKNKGKLIALDVSKKKLEELRRRARRAGLFNVQALQLEYARTQQEGATALTLPPEIAKLAGTAQRVLVDAPCSGVGAFRHNPEARWRLSEEDFNHLKIEQEQIARTAMSLCKVGGRMIYATCSVLKEENEEIVERLLKNPGNEKLVFELVPLKEIIGGELASQVSDSSGLFLKLLPHRQQTDGFFAAVLRRKA